MAPGLAEVFDVKTTSVDLPCSEEIAPKLEIVVFFTTPPSTRAALRKAGALASRLGAGILVLSVQIVPYPLPLTAPPVALGFDESRIRRIASECPVDTKVLLCLGRDLWSTLSLALSPNSLVVLGAKKRPWPTRETRLARKLRRADHEVIVVETE